MECIILMGVGIIIGMYVTTQIERGIKSKIRNRELINNLKNHEIQKHKKHTKTSGK